MVKSTRIDVATVKVVFVRHPVFEVLRRNSVCNHTVWECRGVATSSLPSPFLSSPFSPEFPRSGSQCETATLQIDEAVTHHC